jgi:hypothetical protein
MQHLKGGGTPVLYIGRTVLKGLKDVGNLIQFAYRFIYDEMKPESEYDVRSGLSLFADTVTQPQGQEGHACLSLLRNMM